MALLRIAVIQKHGRDRAIQERSRRRT
ncbi:D-tyrosyl-tRNA(Tyr) deacylase (EC 3.6.1.n1) [Caballeronia sordidicola]|uniref:D-tyrosyl-tRNA(Tyr) deacylase n=1 Tax=Caballeronia sordidicola TaxID=196367 RepID=A0A242M5N5_CABSO|nr:D-tyrosyl-tRNA(Tyr) deacylase (EC 3.6.1.n1) [Caballeronia sordidicola]